MVTLKYNWGNFSSGKSDEIFSRWGIISPTKLFPDEVFPDKVVKDHELQKAFRIFVGTGIKITSDGRRHLGWVIGTNQNKNKFIDEKMGEWCK